MKPPTSDRRTVSGEGHRPPRLGLLEWFRPGEHDCVERVLADLKELGVTELRTGLSWADWHTPEGEKWYSWLLPRLAREVSVLPCLHYTPPSLGLEPRTSAPPRDPKAFADFVDHIIDRLGDHFEWVELWNEPNNLTDYDWRLDPGWERFSAMVGGAAYWARQRGKRTVLGGMCPLDPNWLSLMGKRGVLAHIDAVGIHAFPGTWDWGAETWSQRVDEVRRVCGESGVPPEIWITETGYSTWKHDEFTQLRKFTEALDAPADRLYWYAAYDLRPDLPTQDGLRSDDRHYHMGLRKTDGTPKLLYRLWASEGIAGVRALATEQSRPVKNWKSGYSLITGGAGFIGTNVAHRLASEGQRVLLLDSLSRPGVEKNLRWLQSTHGPSVQISVADIRDPFAVRQAVAGANQIFHFAAQVAVTTSLVTPRHDFGVNAEGTLNLLEALRGMRNPPPLLFTSTNKVYGELGDLGMSEFGQRWEPDDEATAVRGISEARPLDFHSPYGCSKGCADQYVVDYARTYGLPAAVFRMSCIYGPHQFGNEDQGWVAHFLIRAIEGSDITLYGDGKQVRDVLFVEDLVDAMLAAQGSMHSIAGQAFNIGGGPERAISLLELIGLIGDMAGEKPRLRFEGWRPGDQKYYVSDTHKFREATGWSPAVGVREGVGKLYDWLLEERGLSLPLAAAKKGAA